jgi:hypothetical protein
MVSAGAAEDSTVDSPYGILLVARLVKGTDILPQRLVQVLDMAQLLDDRAAEVDGKVCAVVIAAGMPAALVAVLFLLALFGCRAVEWVEIKEALGRGRHDGAWLERLVRGRGGVTGGGEQQQERSE